MMNIKTYQNEGHTIIFEPDQEFPEGFIKAKTWCNSIALESGNFPVYAFNKNFVREPTQEESDYYQSLKERSQYALNAE